MKKIAKQGFTLTELMAVVIILAILMGIAAGGYRKATERSNFSEGLSMAHAIAEAVDRYHGQHPSVNQPEIDKLDIGITNKKACSDLSATAKLYCAQIAYFRIFVRTDGSVQAVRTNDKYTITVYPESFGTHRYSKDTCAGKDGNTDFCVSVGYTSCTSGTCVKPD